MPIYNQSHQFYASEDLHARSMFVHVRSAKGKSVFERGLPAESDAFLKPSSDTENAGVGTIERRAADVVGQDVGEVRGDDLGVAFIVVLEQQLAVLGPGRILHVAVQLGG